jgi:hypothetical protein
MAYSRENFLLYVAKFKEKAYPNLTNGPFLTLYILIILSIKKTEDKYSWVSWEISVTMKTQRLETLRTAQ